MKFKKIFLPVLLIALVFVSLFVVKNKIKYKADTTCPIVAAPPENGLSSAPAVCNANKACEKNENKYNCPSDCPAKLVSPDIQTGVSNLWPAQKSAILSEYPFIGTASKTTYPLYRAQAQSQSVLNYASLTNDRSKMDDIADLILGSEQYLKNSTEVAYRNYPGKWNYTSHPLPYPSKMWTYPITDTGVTMEYESVLYSGQFIYFAANAINIFSDIDSSLRSDKMNLVIAHFSPIVSAHYNRWVFDDHNQFNMKSSGCGKITDPNMNHADFMLAKLNKTIGLEAGARPQVCYGLTDADMWLVSGASEMVATASKHPEVYSLSSEILNNFKSYIGNGSALIQSKLTESNLTDFNGHAVKGFNFDLGAQDNIKNETDYSGYSCSNIADLPAAPEGAVTDIGWDISHAIRFVSTFESLSVNRQYSGLSFPDSTVLTKLANQLIYGSFNKNFRFPLFSNYMNGTNGWYRVNYGGAGNGRAPYDLSSSFPVGYVSWAKYNSDYDYVIASYYNLFNSSDSDLAAHKRNFYMSNGYVGGQRTFSSSINDILLPFYAGLAHDSLTSSGFAPDGGAGTTNTGTIANTAAIGSAPSKKTSSLIKAPSQAQVADVANDQGGKILISWSASKTTKIDGYKIFRSENESGDFLLVGQVDNRTLEFIDTTAAGNNKVYYYFVRSYRGVLESASSITVSAAASDNLPPAQVTDLTITLKSNHLLFAWQPVRDADLADLSLEISRGDDYKLFLQIDKGVSTYDLDLSQLDSTKVSDISKLTFSFRSRDINGNNSVATIMQGDAVILSESPPQVAGSSDGKSTKKIVLVASSLFLLLLITVILVVKRFKLRSQKEANFSL